MCRLADLPSSVCGSILKRGLFSDLFLISYRTRKTTDLTGYSVGVQEVRQEINLDRVRLSPHTLRPGFALAYIENGGDRGSLVLHLEF